MNIIELDKSPLSVRIISDFISKNEYLLPDPLSLHVDITKYTGKLNQHGRTFVCMDVDDIVGFVSGYINDLTKKEAYIQVIIVAEFCQGKKIGSQLMDAFIEASKATFIHGKVFLTVDKSNKKANSIYIHKGFVKSDRIHANPLKSIMEFKF